MKVQLTMSEEQARTIIDALDFYSRIGMGQMKEIRPLLERSFVRQLPAGNDGVVDSYINEMKILYFPEFKGTNGYHGIFNKDTHEESKSAWDLIQVLRFAMAWHNKPSGGSTVDFGTPIKSSTEEELAEVNILTV